MTFVPFAGLVRAVGCTVGTKIFPVVPRHALATHIVNPLSIVRHRRLLKAPKSPISLYSIFFRHTVFSLFSCESALPRVGCTDW